MTLHSNYMAGENSERIITLNDDVLEANLRSNLFSEVTSSGTNAFLALCDGVYGVKGSLRIALTCEIIMSTEFPRIKKLKEKLKEKLEAEMDEMETPQSGEDNRGLDYLSFFAKGMNGVNQVQHSDESTNSLRQWYENNRIDQADLLVESKMEAARDLQDHLNKQTDPIADEQLRLWSDFVTLERSDPLGMFTKLMLVPNAQKVFSGYPRFVLDAFIFDMCKMRTVRPVCTIQFEMDVKSTMHVVLMLPPKGWRPRGAAPPGRS